MQKEIYGGVSEYGQIFIVQVMHIDLQLKKKGKKNQEIKKLLLKKEIHERERNYVHLRSKQSFAIFCHLWIQKQKI